MTCTVSKFLLGWSALLDLFQIMRGLCKEADYFITDEKDRVQAMMDVETLCDGLQLLQLKDLVSRVEDAKDDKVNARKVIKQEVRTEKESFFLFFIFILFLFFCEIYSRRWNHNLLLNLTRAGFVFNFLSSFLKIPVILACENRWSKLQSIFDSIRKIIHLEINKKSC